MGIIQNLLEKGFSAFYKKISFLPQSFSTKEFSAYEPDASEIEQEEPQRVALWIILVLYELSQSKEIF